MAPDNCQEPFARTQRHAPGEACAEIADMPVKKLPVIDAITDLIAKHRALAKEPAGKYVTSWAMQNRLVAGLQ